MVAMHEAGRRVGRSAALVLIATLAWVLAAFAPADDPEWAGYWELVDGPDEMTEVDYWAMSEDRVVILQDRRDEPGEMACRGMVREITEIDGDVLIDERDASIQVAVAEGTLEARVLHSPMEEEIGAELTLESVEALPFDLEECALR